ncbi:MAG: hypothetical protein DMG32_16090 [Acidobacteria bacterium]|nr:MAG: hypothetical protein DMG32_16090 [Acidobacteriota bacterium]
MAALYGDAPQQIFREFCEHLNRLLHTTITDANLRLLAAEHRHRGFLEFRQGEHGEIRCARVGGSYYLFLAQTLEAEEKMVEGSKKYRLRTLRYAYRVTEGPTLDSRWLFRWEYESPKIKPHLYPRHHIHVNTGVNCFSDRFTLNCSELHVPSGWIAIEEVIRFLIHELRLEPKRPDWDQLLLDSEERFTEWTERTI